MTWTTFTSRTRRSTVALQVDHFIDLLSKRYGIQPNEVVDAIQWVRSHKGMETKLQFGAMVSVVSVMIGAILVALWEGVKHMVSEKP